MTKHLIVEVSAFWDGGRLPDTRTFDNELDADAWRREREAEGAITRRSRTVAIKCCGRTLYCQGFTTTCPECGADYNWNGTRLAPRHQWGKETDEYPADIARIP